MADFSQLVFFTLGANIHVLTLLLPSEGWLAKGGQLVCMALCTWAFQGERRKRCEAGKWLCRPGVYTVPAKGQLSRNTRADLARSSRGFKQSLATRLLCGTSSFLNTNNTLKKKKNFNTLLCKQNITGGPTGPVMCYLSPDLSPWSNRPGDSSTPSTELSTWSMKDSG